MDCVWKKIAVVTAALVLAACSRAGQQGTAGGEHSWTQPGTLRMNVQQEPKNLNPLLTSNTTDVALNRLFSDPLVSADPKGEFVPILAKDVPTLEDGGISKDGLTYTYHLRSGVKWSDGQPFTSYDVKFSWQAMMNPANNIQTRHGYDEVRSIDTPNDATVVVHLKEKFAPFVSAFFGDSDAPITVVPQHILGKYPNINQVPFNNAPIGTGPFKVSEWVRGDHITFVANDDYFLGKPGLRKIVVKIVPDETTSLNQLRTHDTDWMFEPSYSTYPELSKLSDITLRWNNINGYEGLWINTQHPPLDDVRVRQAIAYAIDKQRLLQTLTFGQQTIATEDLPDWMWAYDTHVRAIQYDPAKAKALLAQAGWKPSTTLVLVTNGSNVTRRSGTVLVQQMLHQVGINVQLHYYDGATLFAPPGEGGILQGGKYDLAWAGWFSGTDPDNSGNYTCAGASPIGTGYSRYCNKEMDAAEQMALASIDRPARKRAYAKIEELIERDTPEIFFWWRRQMQAINPDFKGLDPNPVTESWNAYQWSI